MSPHLAWTKGGSAQFVALDDDRVTLDSTTSSAPGSRIDGLFDDGTALRVKVHRCRRAPQGEGPARFTIDARLLDASRGVRELIVRLTAPPP